MKRTTLSVLTLLLLSSLTLAEEPTSRPAPISASNKSDLDANKGKTVTIQGTISQAAWSKTGRVLILKFANTDDSGFTAVVFSNDKDAFNKAFDGDAAKSLTNANVKITGKLTAFHDKPQIVLNKPSQLTLDKPSTKPAEK
jgi:DNA/RNA endonuclease YhcR with UshA esterase domain